MCNLIKYFWRHAKYTMDSVIYYEVAELGFQGCKFPRLIGVRLMKTDLASGKTTNLCETEMTPIRLQPMSNSFIDNIGRDVYDEN